MSTYSYDEVSRAANRAADMLGLDADAATLIDFMVNATLTLLETPDADIQDVLEENWGDSDDLPEVRKIILG